MDEQIVSILCQWRDAGDEQKQRERAQYLQQALPKYFPVDDWIAKHPSLSIDVLGTELAQLDEVGG